MAFNGGSVELFSGNLWDGHLFSLSPATWEWDGQLWTERQDMVPAGRMGAGMAADPVRGAMVLFGGYGSANGPYILLGDTWEHVAAIAGGG